MNNTSPLKSAGAANAAPQRWQTFWVCLALVVMIFAVFGRTLRCGFVNYDDSDIYDNPVVDQGLTLQGTAWAFAAPHSSNWYPLNWLSHMLDCQLYGLHPAGHHLTNVLLHAASAVLLFLVLREMTGALWRSAFVAAVFAVHPLRVESVAWVTERKDVLSGFFFILTIAAYVRYARRPWSWGRYGLVVALFAAGLMSKPMLVTVPVLLLAMDYWPLQRRESIKRLVLEKLPLLALSAAVCAVTIFAQREVIQSAATLAPLPHRLGNALASCVIYLRQMVWPAGLTVLYPYPRNGVAGWKMALAGALLAGASAIVIGLRRKQPWLLVGWLWYLVMLLPVLGIIQVGVQAHADRYTYLPQIGIYMAFTWLAAGWRMNRAVLGVLMSGTIIALMVCAWNQIAYWQNGETLWTRALACDSKHEIGRNSLGQALMQEGKVDDAIAQYQAALQSEPDDVEVRNNLGVALHQKGREDEAIAQYQLALRNEPDYAEARNNLGVSLRQIGKLDDAIAQYRQALQIQPDYAAAHDNLGVALFQIDRTADAIAQFHQALQLKPEDPEIQRHLAWLLATCAEAPLRNGDQALELARRANELSGGSNPLVLRTLAAAFAEKREFADAVQTIQKAIDLANSVGRQDMVTQFDTELQRYQAGLPFHQ